MLSSPLSLRSCMWVASFALACSSNAGPPPASEPQGPREKLCVLEASVSVTSPVELEPLCGCTRIEGDVSIDAAAVPDLACLKGLREVTGAFAISAPASAPSLESLAGLAALERVGTLTLTGLSVTNVEALRRLSEAQSVVLVRLASLESLTGLTGRFERLQLSECDRLTDLSGLRADVRDLWLEKNARLGSLDGFSGLPVVAAGTPGSTVRLESLPSLERLDGLFREDSPRLTRLQLIGLPKLERVDARAAREIGALVIRTCNVLREIVGFESIESIGQLHLTGLPELSRLPPFGRLRSAVDLELIELPRIRDLAELSSLETLDRIAFTMLDGLVSLHGLEHVSQAERILLEDLLALESLEGLSGLQRVHTFWIGGDDALESLGGLTLRDAEELVVRYNDGLATLEGLEALRNVGTLDVSENAKLGSVRALRGLEDAGRVFARQNPSLPACELEWLSAALPENTIRDFGDNGPPGTCPP